MYQTQDKKYKLNQILEQEKLYWQDISWNRRSHYYPKILKLTNKVETRVL